MQRWTNDCLRLSSSLYSQLMARRAPGGSFLPTSPAWAAASAAPRPQLGEHHHELVAAKRATVSISRTLVFNRRATSASRRSPDGVPAVLLVVQGLKLSRSRNISAPYSPLRLLAAIACCRRSLNRRRLGRPVSGRRRRGNLILSSASLRSACRAVRRSARRRGRRRRAEGRLVEDDVVARAVGIDDRSLAGLYAGLASSSRSAVS